jgi:hypothetical protein
MSVLLAASAACGVYSLSAIESVVFRVTLSMGRREYALRLQTYTHNHSEVPRERGLTVQANAKGRLGRKPSSILLQLLDRKKNYVALSLLFDKIYSTMD